MALPQIERINSVVKLNGILYEQNEDTRNDKVLAYLNQTGLINFNETKGNWRKRYGCG